MNMIPMREIIPEIILDVPGCPNPIIERAFRNTLMDFTRRGECWIFRQDYAVTLENFSEVKLTIPEHTRIIKVLSANMDGRILVPASEKVLDNQVPDWRDHSGEPRAFFEMPPNTLRLWPTPVRETVGELQMTLALMPTRAANFVDEDLVDNWLEGLTAGVQARLMDMPDKPWTNHQMAMKLAEQYETAVRHATRYARGDHYAKARVTAYGGL